MIYTAQLLKEHSRSNTDKIAKAIGSDAKELKKIIDIIYNEKNPLPQRASWILAVINEKQPNLLKPYLPKFINSIENFKIDGIKRNILNVIEKHQISEKLQGKLANICFNFILSANETVAVKVFSLQCLSNIAEKHQELIPEIKSVIDNQLTKTSAAFHARSKIVMKKLNKIQSK